jgi:pentatricopeptide repeat protein
VAHIVAGYKISFPQTNFARRLEKKVNRFLAAADHAKSASAASIERQKEFQRLRREEAQNQWDVDWRQILADLAKYTPDHGPWLEKALQVLVPESSMSQLMHGIDDHMWAIARKYGCSAQLGDSDEYSNQCRKFFISGSMVALAKAIAEVIRTHPDVEITAPWKVKSGGEAPNGSESISTTSSEHTNIRRVPAKDGPQTPKSFTSRPNWTPEVFLDYVKSIVNSDMTAHQRMYDLKINPDFRADAAATLRDLFVNPACRTSITKTACHEALQFFVKHNLIKDVRMLFVRMDMMKIPMDVGTFNIMLRGASKTEDLHNFRFILHLMLKRGYIPNPDTWTAFLMAHSDVHVKVHIVTAMQKKGIVSDQHTLKAVVQELVGVEIESSLDKLQSQEDFVAHMDARYGSRWLSIDVGNRILNVMGSRGLISHCWQFLHFMASRFIPPTNVSIHTILGYCKSQRNLAGAIEILGGLPLTAKFIPDKDTYTRLFGLAWEVQCYNVARVAWRYACLSAATTFSMRSRLLKNLEGTALPYDKPMHPRRQVAAPVVFGTSYRGSHPVQVANRITRHNRVMEKIAQPEVPRTAEIESPVVGPLYRPSEFSDKLQERLKRDPKPKSKIPLETEAGLDSNLKYDTRLDLVPKISQLPQGADVYPETIYPFPYNPEKLPRGLSKRKTNILQALLELDYLIFNAWKPAKPFSEMIVLAFKKDQEWRANKRVISGTRTGSEARMAGSQGEESGLRSEKDSQVEDASSKAVAEAADVKAEIKWKIDNAIAIPLLWKDNPTKDSWEWK